MAETACLRPQDRRTDRPQAPPLSLRRAWNLWARVWMRWSGLGPFGRLATRLAVIGVPPHSARKYLAKLTPRGFVSPEADIHHKSLSLGRHVFIDDRTLIFQGEEGGAVELGDRVSLFRDVMLQTGLGGRIRIGSATGIQPRCQLMALVASIEVGRGVMIGANSTLYSYDHGISPDKDIFEQPLQSKGPIIIGDGAWLGTGVVVLSGVTIGRGAVVGAGAVVTKDVPDMAIAVGVPARVVKFRDGNRE